MTYFHDKFTYCTKMIGAGENFKAHWKNAIYNIISL